MSTKSTNPFAEIAAVVEGRAKKHAAGAVSTVASVLGKMTPRGIKLDFFAHEVTDYLVAESLKLDTTHPLQTGDRVLCVMVDGGNTPVVICKVVNP